jgi:hypothetical protein
MKSEGGGKANASAAVCSVSVDEVNQETGMFHVGVSHNPSMATQGRRRLTDCMRSILPAEAPDGGRYTVAPALVEPQQSDPYWSLVDDRESEKRKGFNATSTN